MQFATYRVFTKPHHKEQVSGNSILICLNPESSDTKASFLEQIHSSSALKAIINEMLRAGSRMHENCANEDQSLAMIGMKIWVHRHIEEHVL